jgi:hypothetical protein
MLKEKWQYKGSNERTYDLLDAMLECGVVKVQEAVNI